MAGELTVQQIGELIEHEVGGRPGVPLSTLEIANQAGHYLVSAHPWRWLEGRQVVLTPRARIDLTGATWTDATRTLTKVGAFASYSFLTGDVIEITGGTGATLGFFDIESRTSDDAIVLVASIGAAADAQTDIAGTMLNDQVELPSDFDLSRITAYSASNSLVGALVLTTPQDLLELRTSSPGLTSVSFWAVLNYVRTAAGGPPIPRLDLWPDVTTSSQQFVIFYRGGWREPLTDTEQLGIPRWLNLVFIELCKAIVLGHEEGDQATVSQRLDAVQGSAMWFNAVRRDASVQPSSGELRGGWNQPGIDYQRAVFNRGQRLGDV